MTKKPVIDITDLSKTFAETSVLNGISLQVFAGEIVAVVGPSGAGKSTLLRCINMLERPSAGRIAVEGRILFADGRTAQRNELLLARRRLGMVFQEFNLFPHLTAVENVQLGLTDGLGLRRREALERSMQALADVGLRERPLAYPEHLSGGQRQRVGIARALALRPAALLLDEPTSALDPELAGGVLDVVRALASEGMTMLISTHELDFAREVADTIVFIDHGAIVEQGSPEKVLGNPSHGRTREFLGRYHRQVARREHNDHAAHVGRHDHPEES